LNRIAPGVISSPQTGQSAPIRMSLLAPWNERSMLQSASDYGKKQAVSDTMGALEDLAEGLKNE